MIKSLMIVIPLLLFTGCTAKKELTAYQELHQKQQEKLQQCELQNKGLQSEQLSIEEINKDLLAENDRLKMQLMAANKSLDEMAALEAQGPEAIERGVVFKVQIGAYVEREIPENLTNSEMLDTEEKGALQKTVVGWFRDYHKAKRLRDQLKAMGVKDAWVVTYNDGKRVSIDAALPEEDNK